MKFTGLPKEKCIQSSNSFSDFYEDIKSNFIGFFWLIHATLLSLRPMSNVTQHQGITKISFNQIHAILVN